MFSTKLYFLTQLLKNENKRPCVSSLSPEVSPFPTTELFCYLRKSTSPNPLKEVIYPAANPNPVDVPCHEPVAE